MVVAELTLDALRQHGTEDLPGYEAALRQACAAHPPPYGMAWYGDRYREVAIDPEWLARSLIANAAKEGEGSAKLWDLAARAGDDTIAELVRLHAVDEARHARYYISLLMLAFPGAVDAEGLAALHGLSPGYRTSDRPGRQPAAADAVVWDELIQMNIGEIRTRIHQLLLRPVLSLHCGAENRPRLTALLDELLDDETRHIEYTARLIEQMCARDRSFVEATMARRLADFNDITLQEVGAATYE